MKSIRILLATIACTLIMSATGRAADCASQASGPWGSPSTWSCGHVPTASDDVTIAAAHTVTAAAGSCHDLFVQGDLQIALSANLTVSGTLTVSSTKTLSGANSGSALMFKGLTVNGSVCINDGVVSANTSFNGAGDQSIGGAGSWTGGTITIGGTGVKSLASDMNLALAWGRGR